MPFYFTTFALKIPASPIIESGKKKCYTENKGTEICVEEDAP